MGPKHLSHLQRHVLAGFSMEKAVPRGIVRCLIFSLHAPDRKHDFDPRSHRPFSHSRGSSLLFDDWRHRILIISRRGVCWSTAHGRLLGAFNRRLDRRSRPGRLGWKPEPGGRVCHSAVAPYGYRGKMRKIKRPVSS
jgi:hypothetical protein